MEMATLDWKDLEGGNETRVVLDDEPFDKCMTERECSAYEKIREYHLNSVLDIAEDLAQRYPQIDSEFFGKASLALREDLRSTYEMFDSNDGSAKRIPKARLEEMRMNPDEVERLREQLKAGEDGFRSNYDSLEKSMVSSMEQGCENDAMTAFMQLVALRSEIRVSSAILDLAESRYAYEHSLDTPEKTAEKAPSEKTVEDKPAPASQQAPSPKAKAAPQKGEPVVIGGISPKVIADATKPGGGPGWRVGIPCPLAARGIADVYVPKDAVSDDPTRKDRKQVEFPAHRDVWVYFDTATSIEPGDGIKGVKDYGPTKRKGKNMTADTNRVRVIMEPTKLAALAEEQRAAQRAAYGDRVKSSKSVSDANYSMPEDIPDDGFKF